MRSADLSAFSTCLYQLISFSILLSSINGQDDQQIYTIHYCRSLVVLAVGGGGGGGGGGGLSLCLFALTCCLFVYFRS